MKALVTGANGFLGRHVVGALLARGIEVRAMIRPAARLEALGWPSSVEVFRADLRTSCELRRAFESVDVLLHLAAQVDVRKSVAEPTFDAEVNIGGFLNLMEAGRGQELDLPKGAKLELELERALYLVKE